MQNTFMMTFTPIMSWIVKTNVVVYFLWYLFLLIDPSFMVQNFLVSWSGLLEGRFWTIITSVFSHNAFFHIFINMYFFYGFGKAIETSIGSKKFLTLYLFSGILGSLAHCFVSALILHEPELEALGASGAISGVLVFFALKYPDERVYLLGLIPLPAFSAIFFFIALDVVGFISQAQGSQIPIGYGAHLGGALGGFLYYFHLASVRGPT